MQQHTKQFILKLVKSALDLERNSSFVSIRQEILYSIENSSKLCNLFSREVNVGRIRKNEVCKS